METSHSASHFPWVNGAASNFFSVDGDSKSSEAENDEWNGPSSNSCCSSVSERYACIVSQSEFSLPSSHVVEDTALIARAVKVEQDAS